MLNLKNGSKDEIRFSNFDDPDFIQDNKEFYDQYIDTRARGYDLLTSFERSFGCCIEGSPNDIECAASIVDVKMRAQIQKRRSQIPAAELWNSRMALEVLIDLANDRRAQTSARLGAVRALNDLVAAMARKGMNSAQK